MRESYGEESDRCLCKGFSRTKSNLYISISSDSLNFHNLNFLPLRTMGIIVRCLCKGFPRIMGLERTSIAREWKRFREDMGEGLQGVVEW